MTILAYKDMYDLLEEIQKLKNSPLQGAMGLSEGRYALDFRLPGESRLLIFDERPASPFFVCLPQKTFKITKPPTLQRTPVINFLRAHFVGKKLELIEIAQKPNRTVRFSFSDNRVLTFKCFPHGQEILLEAEGKSVWHPKRSGGQKRSEIQNNPITFIETELSESWALNQKLEADIFTSKLEFGSKQDVLAQAQTQPKVSLKLEKAIAQVDQAIRETDENGAKRILELEAHAFKIKLRETKGDLGKVYDEIKKIKRQGLKLRERKNSLLDRMGKIERGEVVAPKAKENFGKKDKSQKKFSGLVIPIRENLELWVGRNARQNDELVKMSGPHELWMHLRDYPGAHGVLRGPKNTSPGVRDIEFACRVVAQLSEKKKSPFQEGERLEFIVTPRKFVRKPKGAPAGQVIVERESVQRIAYKRVTFES